jgi:hypothetical protein
MLFNYRNKEHEVDIRKKEIDDAVTLVKNHVGMTLCGMGAKKGNCNLSQFLKQTSLSARYNLELIDRAGKIALSSL